MVILGIVVFLMFILNISLSYQVFKLEEILMKHFPDEEYFGRY